MLICQSEQLVNFSKIMCKRQQTLFLLCYRGWESWGFKWWSWRHCLCSLSSFASSITQTASSLLLRVGSCDILLTWVWCVHKYTILRTGPGCTLSEQNRTFHQLHEKRQHGKCLHQARMPSIKVLLIGIITGFAVKQYVSFSRDCCSSNLLRPTKTFWVTG